MSLFGSPFGQQSITQNQAEYAYQIAERLLTEWQTDQRVIQGFNQLITNNQAAQQEFLRAAQAAFSTPGIADGAGGVHAQVFAQAFAPWVKQAAITVFQLLQKQQQGVSLSSGLTGNLLPSIGGASSVLGGGQTANYDTFSVPTPAPAPAPAQPAQPAVQPQAQSSSSFLQKGATQPMSQTAAPQPSQPVTLDFTAATPAALERDKRAHIRVETYELAEHDGRRVSRANIIWVPRANNPLEVVRGLVNHAPAQLLSGDFAHVVGYHELHAIPGVATDSFLKLRDKAGDAYSSKGWEAVLGVLADISRRDADPICDALVRQINHKLYRRMRLADKMTGILLIDDIAELKKCLFNPEWESPFKSKVAYDDTVEEIVNSVFAAFFTQPEVVVTRDVGFGDFLACEDVVWANAAGNTKFDIGLTLTGAERDKAMSDVLGAATVLRLPRLFVYTNAMATEAMSALHNRQTIATGQAGMMNSILAHTNIVNGVDTVVARSPKIPVQEFTVGAALTKALDGKAYGLAPLQSSLGW